MSIIAHCIKKCLSQGDRYRRIKHIKSHCERGRKEDVQVFMKSMSPAPAGVGRSGGWEDREREEMKGFMRAMGGVNKNSPCCVELVHKV